jgi:purine-binding chemotaxis protein CheW
MESKKQYCVFKLGGITFGIEAGHVQEVLKAQGWTPVPLSPAGVQGVMNLRGQIVTVLDLRHRLALAEMTEGQSFVHMILQSQEEYVSLLVDEIGDVVDVEQGMFEEPPPTLGKEIRKLIQGAYKLKGSLLLTLDMKEAVQFKG